MRSQRLPLLLTITLLIHGVSGGVAAADNTQVKHERPTSLEPLLTTPQRPSTRLVNRRNLIVKAVQQVRAAVVNIHSERTVRQPQGADLLSVAPSQNRINGMGTGIIVDERGYIVTNHHVVEDVSVIRIQLHDGTTTNASVVARRRDVDLALLKIDTSQPLQTMPLGTADDLMPGEDVIAIGNAYGYTHTVSRGIVSAVKRDVRLNKEIFYKSLIQTDASINPGNSGGPLVNINGELVGVNVAIRAGAQGIGFAIPVDTMVGVVSSLLRTERLKVAKAGLNYQDKVQLGHDGAERRVVLQSVGEKTPAGQAGLQTNDEILRIGAVAVNCSYDIDRALLGQKPGARIPVLFRRKGKKFRTTVVLGKSSGSGRSPIELVWAKLGLKLAPVRRDLVGQVNQQLNGGMRVVSIAPNGIAGRAGIREGDILVGLHRWETTSMDNVGFVLMHPDLATFSPLSFYIIRNGQVRRGWLGEVE
ncbi:MAG: trypsin-like peptidase domain-containing protein [Gemmataceae bacterium]